MKNFHYYFSSPTCGWSPCEQQHYDVIMQAISFNPNIHEGWRLMKVESTPVFV